MSTKDYLGREVIVNFDGSRCIHAAECVGGLPEVFDPDARPWIDPDKATAQDIARVVARCPTGALTVRRLDGEALEQPDPRNTVGIRADGPLHLRGRVTVTRGDGAPIAEYMRVALCRCGASANRPFCDGSHSRIAFADPGRAKTEAGDPVDAGACTGPVEVRPIPDGPLMVKGRVEFRTADGGSLVGADQVWLCRCGASANKPFCDGSHKRVAFTG